MKIFWGYFKNLINTPKHVFYAEKLNTKNEND